jgi:hypothetical protein
MSDMDLSSITMNYATRPPRVVIYGDHKIGKSTFACSAPNPIVIRTEDGLAAIRVPAFPLAKFYSDVRGAIETLYKGGHRFQTAVLDSLDWLEPLVWAHTASAEGKNGIEDIGYGKGYIMADEYWREILDGLDALNANGMTIICLAHAEIKRFDAPDTEAYDRYQIKLHKRAAAMVQEWADVIGFAHHEIMTVSQDVGFNKTTTRGVSAGRRILSVEERPAYYAGNRYSLPADLPFPKVGAWEEFAKACAPAFAEPAPDEQASWLANAGDAGVLDDTVDVETAEPDPDEVVAVCYDEEGNEVVITRADREEQEAALAANE